MLKSPLSTDCSGGRKSVVVQRFLTLSLAALVIVVSDSCKKEMDHNEAFVSLAEEYIERFLEMYPETATALGDHHYDHRLNDYSVQGVRDGIEFNKSSLRSLNRIDPGRLTRDNRVDYYILRNQIEESVFRLETLKEHEWNPLVYNVGGAIYNLLARDFAPIEDRLRNVAARLDAIPEVVALAKANLKRPPRVHTETAIQQNAGTIGLIGEELDRFIAEAPHMIDEVQPARERALDALGYYGSWLEKDLLPLSDGDFRLGKEKFEKKLGYVLESALTAEEILERAERGLVETQQVLFETARPLFEQYFPGVPVDDGPDGRKRVISDVLGELAKSRPDNETIVDEARKCLEECRAFTTRHDLVTVPSEPIELIVMPEFQRGVAVAYCDAPGPLEREGKTFFAISPTPEDWSEERVESFFKEYNDYMLQNLTIHEAIPGHYLQLAHANRFEAPTLVRSIFYSGPFVEGWATYSEQLMAEAGYGGPQLRMQQLKMRLRMIINVILDQKVHTAGMTEDEAMQLMIDEGFQEDGEAAGKWRRACLTSTQLSTYFVGNIEVNEIRRAYENRHGAESLLEMHDKMLSFGSPPAKYVKELLGL